MACALLLTLQAKKTRSKGTSCCQNSCSSDCTCPRRQDAMRLGTMRQNAVRGLLHSTKESWAMMVAHVSWSYRAISIQPFQANYLQAIVAWKLCASFNSAECAAGVFFSPCCLLLLRQGVQSIAMEIFFYVNAALLALPFVLVVSGISGFRVGTENGPRGRRGAAHRFQVYSSS